MNKQASISKTMGIGGLIVVLALVAVALLLVVWPNAMAAAETPPGPSNPTLSPDAPLPDVPIVFVSRNRLETLDNIHVGPPLDVPGRERTPGGRLLLWRPDGSVTDLTAGTSLYDVQQPDVSFDGTKVVFSAVTGRGEQWHLYEIGLDGTGFRQLTDDDRDIPIPDDPRDPGRNERVFGRYGDFGPAYLPDGRIIFVSTRYMTLSGSCGQRGQNLYVLDPETGEMHRRTTERAGAIDPAVLSDGTVVFSHWIDAMNEPATDGPGLRPLETDYNFAPSFWGILDMNPDGTGAHRYAFLRGGLQDDGGAYQPHELPDGDLVVTFRGAGSLLGDTLANAITRIEPGLVEPHELRFLGDPYNLEGPHALGPAPLPDGRIVCSYTPTSTVEIDWRGRHTASYDFGLYVVDEKMKTLAPLYNEPDTDELDAVAVYPRSAPVIPDHPNADLITDDPTVELGTTATMINHNLYADLPLDVVELPSPKVGTVVGVVVYDDSQTFTTTNRFPLLQKQMPRFVGSFPVDEHGAFTATVPADKALLFVLVNHNGVAVRSPMSLLRPNAPGNSITHSFNGHDYLRPDDVIQCTGCHKGHMMQPDLAMEAQANLSRLAVATASSEIVPFFAGAWRANDLRLAEEARPEQSRRDGRYAWATDDGSGAWVQLDWPMEIEATQAVLYPLTARGCRVTAATLTLSDGTSYHIGPLHDDGSPLVIPFDPPSTISWIRFTVDEAISTLVGLAELVVNGPPDVALPDTPPPTPTNLTTTDGVLFLQWNRVADPGLAGYKLYYGTEPGQYIGSVDVGDVSRFMARDLPQDGVTYYVAAKAYNVYGTESLTFSNEVSATAHAPLVTSIKPDHGPIGGGTPITITGQYFAPRGVRVSLGGEHAYGVEVVDEQTITAITHWHMAGTVDVVVFNPDDLFGILPDGFTYKKPEPPTDADISAGE